MTCKLFGTRSCRGMDLAAHLKPIAWMPSPVRKRRKKKGSYERVSVGYRTAAPGSRRDSRIRVARPNPAHFEWRVFPGTSEQRAETRRSSDRGIRRFHCEEARNGTAAVSQNRCRYGDGIPRHEPCARSRLPCESFRSCQPRTCSRTCSEIFRRVYLRPAYPFSPG